MPRGGGALAHGLELGGELLQGALRHGRGDASRSPCPSGRLCRTVRRLVAEKIFKPELTQRRAPVLGTDARGHKAES